MFFKSAEKKTFGTKPARQPEAAPEKDDVNRVLKDLIITVTALRDVLLRENDALDHSNSRAFMEIQDEKVAIARTYEHLMTGLLGREDIESCDVRLKNQLLSLEEGFTSVMRENLTKLERMKSATEKLGERIMKSARKSAEGLTQFAYGSSGTMQKGVKATMGLSEQA